MPQEDVVIFRIFENGEREQLGPGAKVSSEDALIIIDFIKRVLIMWRGSKISVHKKFAVARNMTQIRLLYTGFKSIEVDEDDEKIDINSYMARISGTAEVRKSEPETEKKSPTPKSMPETKEEVVSPSTKPSMLLLVDDDKTPPQTAVSQQSRAVSATPPKQATPSTETEEREYTAKEESKTREQAKTVLEKIEKIAVPEGYERDVVIIGENAYAYSEIVTSAFGKRSVRRRLEKISNLPEGIVVVENYVPRLVVENGKILAIEFLKPSTTQPVAPFQETTTYSEATTTYSATSAPPPAPQPTSSQVAHHEKQNIEEESGLIIESPLDVAEKPLVEEKPKSSLDDLVEFFKKIKK